MSVSATGMLSLPLANMRTLLSVLSAFQTWTSAADAAAALAFIHLVQFDDPAQGSDTKAAWRTAREALRPLALVGFDDGLATDVEATGAYWPAKGPLVATFEEIAQNENGVATAENTVDTDDAILHISNSVGAILEELASTVEAGGYIDLVGWTMRTNPARMAPEDVKAGELDLVAVQFQFDRRDL